MKLMGKGNQVSEPGNQITNAALEKNKKKKKRISGVAKVVIDSNAPARHWMRRGHPARPPPDLICGRVVMIKY